MKSLWLELIQQQSLTRQGIYIYSARGDCMEKIKFNLLGWKGETTM